MATFAKTLSVLPMIVCLIFTTNLRSQVCTPAGQVYIVTCDGSLSPDGKAATLPSKTLGIASIDYSNNLTLSGDASLGGQPASETATGSVAMNSNCTGNVTVKRTLNGQSAPTLNYLLVMTPDLNTIHALNVDQLNVFSCTLTRVSPNPQVTPPIAPPTPPQISGMPSQPIVPVPSPHN